MWPKRKKHLYKNRIISFITYRKIDTPVTMLIIVKQLLYPINVISNTYVTVSWLFQRFRSNAFLSKDKIYFHFCHHQFLKRNKEMSKIKESVTDFETCRCVLEFRCKNDAGILVLTTLQLPACSLPQNQTHVHLKDRCWYFPLAFCFSQYVPFVKIVWPSILFQYVHGFSNKNFPVS